MTLLRLNEEEYIFLNIYIYCEQNSPCSDPVYDSIDYR